MSNSAREIQARRTGVYIMTDEESDEAATAKTKKSRNGSAIAKSPPQHCRNNAALFSAVVTVQPHHSTA
jgi:hypothetical protein